MVSDARMEEVLSENKPEEAAAILMEAAKEAGGRDNISVVIYLDGEAGQ